MCNVNPDADPIFPITFEEYNAEQYEVWVKRMAKSQSEVSVLIRALYWILNNPGAHRGNIRSVVLEALSKTHNCLPTKISDVK